MSDLTPRQKLIALRDALLRPLPEGFRWDYSDFGFITTDKIVGFESCGCAICLAGNLTLLDARDFDAPGTFSTRAGIVFGLSPKDAQRIFIEADAYLEEAEATPTDVADVIDRVLAETPNV